MELVKTKETELETEVEDVCIESLEVLHPVMISKYVLDTDMIVELQEEVEKWIRNKAPGGIVFGMQRLGKTFAIKFLKELLMNNAELGVPIFTICCRYSNKSSEGNFFSYILRDLGFEYSEKGTIAQKRKRVSNIILEKGLESKRKQVVFFIDDTQLLGIPEYHWLMDIFNELDRHEITMTTILVGQDELKTRRNAMKKANQNQIIGRFMVYDISFKGIKTKENLAYVLQMYDEGTEFPKGSGVSFTNYFFPQGFSKGNRLLFSLDEIWKMFVDINARSNTNLEIPMQFITTTVDYIFKKYGVNGETLSWISKKQWKEAIKNSNYLEYINSF